jgi:hypothetical protein
MRTSLALLFVVSVLTVPAGTAAEPAHSLPLPLIPVTTSLQYWENHWFVWLPHHPVCEAVEIASNPGVGGGRP